MSRAPISRKKAPTKTIITPRQTGLKRSAKPKAVPRQRATPRPKRALPSFTAWSLQDLTPSTLRWLTIMALTMVIAGASTAIYAWINNPSNLPIEQVEIPGQFNYLKVDELKTQMLPFTETNLLLLDEVGLETMLEQQPWVRSASLRKIWPNRLEVKLEEQVPIAFWGKDQLLNQYGDIFTASLPEKEGIFPYLYSPSEKGRELGERYVYLTKFLSNLSLEIAELTEDAAGSWVIRFREGPEVIIGRKDYEKRLSRLKVGYIQALKEKFSQIRRIDLRYTNGFAVEWKQIPTSFLESDISKRIGS